MNYAYITFMILFLLSFSHIGCQFNNVKMINVDNDSADVFVSINKVIYFSDSIYRITVLIDEKPLEVSYGNAKNIKLKKGFHTLYCTNNYDTLNYKSQLFVGNCERYVLRVNYFFNVNDTMQLQEIYPNRKIVYPIDTTISNINRYSVSFSCESLILE